MTEKRNPTHDLQAFKDWALTKDFRATRVALRGATDLGFTATDMIDVIQTMRREHFRKSMTSFEDHRVWQDVYYVPSDTGLLYVKFRDDAVTEFLLLSFKEKGDG